MLPYIAGFPFSSGCSSAAPFLIHRGKFSDNRGKFSAKTGKNKLFFGVLWCFLGNLGDLKGQKQRIVLLLGFSWCCFHPLLWWRWWCPPVAGGQGSGPAGCWRWSSGGALPAFCPLCCFACGAMPLKYAFIRILGRFLAGFYCSVWVCIALVLCVACRAFVCVSG